MPSSTPLWMSLLEGCLYLSEVGNNAKLLFFTWGRNRTNNEFKVEFVNFCLEQIFPAKSDSKTFNPLFLMIKITSPYAVRVL